MARPSNRAERRHTLAVAFGRLLAERGYAGATMAELARASGLRQGLVHYHFESKQEILLALLEHLAHGLEARVAARTTASSTPHQALLAYIDAHVALSTTPTPRRSRPGSRSASRPSASPRSARPTRAQWTPSCLASRRWSRPRSPAGPRMMRARSARPVVPTHRPG